MKRVLTVTAVLLALALLAPTGAAYAAPSAKTTPGTVEVSSGVHLVRVASNERQPPIPQSLRLTCAWFHWESNRYNFYDYVLQADLLVLVNIENESVYCGYYQIVGHDRLLNNCHTFYGWGSDGYSGPSQYSVFHCTHTEYDFYGNVVYKPCPNGYTPISIDGETYTDSGDSIWAPSYAWGCR